MQKDPLEGLLSQGWQTHFQLSPFPVLQDYLLRYFYMLFSIQGLGLQVQSLTYTIACM